MRFLFYRNGDGPVSGLNEALGVPHHAAFLPLPVALLLRRPFVVGLLALGEADLELGATLAPVHGGGDEGVALALHGADEPGQFFPMQQ